MDATIVAGAIALAVILAKVVDHLVGTVLNKRRRGNPNGVSQGLASCEAMLKEIRGELREMRGVLAENGNKIIEVLTIVRERGK